MKKKVEKKEYVIGEVLASNVNEKIVSRFEETARMRNEAHTILNACSLKDRETWQTVLEEYNLPKHLRYEFHGNTREVTVAGLMREA